VNESMYISRGRIFAKWGY